MTHPGQTPALRDDILVSACFSHLTADAADFAAVTRLAAELDARFRFREIVVIVDEGQKDAFLDLVRRVDNLRLLTVRDGTPFYRRRVIAAEEAIGDAILMASAAELALVDAVTMLARAADEQTAVMAVRATTLTERIMSAPIAALGRMAGFKVGLHDLQTLAVPRTVLNQLLTHPDPELALRFPPRDIRVPMGFAPVAANGAVPRQAGQSRRRAALLRKLLVYIAPHLLMLVTLTSALLALLGLCFGVYVIGAWILVDTIAAGWLTLSAMLSLSAFFIGISFMGLSLGLQQVLAQTGRPASDSAVSEVNRIDLFGQVATELNVHLHRDGPDR